MKFEFPREFKGVWIPAEIYLDNRLSPGEKILLAEIDSLDGEDGCYASNRYLAEFCKMSEATLKRSLLKLKEWGLIEPGGYRGRCRVWMTRLKMSQVPGSKRSKYMAQNDPPVIEVSNTKRNTEEGVPPGAVSDPLPHDSSDEKELAGKIEKAFLSQQPWTNWPKERLAIKRLIKVARSLVNGSDPEVITRAWMEMFYRLINGKLRGMNAKDKHFWSVFAFTPSKMGSMLDDINAYLKKADKDINKDKEAQAWYEKNVKNRNRL